MNGFETLWIEKLAVEEANMEQSGTVDISSHINPTHFLEESSIHLMEDIRELFEISLAKFNTHRLINGTSKAIKIFKISNTVNDFMLFRNSLKLVVARKSADVIGIGFVSHSGGLYSARLSSENQPSKKVHELKAHIGPFNEISWQFKGEVVNLQALVKHYLTEFIKISMR